MAEIIENGHTMQHQSIPNGKINAGLTLRNYRYITRRFNGTQW